MGMKFVDPETNKVVLHIFDDGSEWVDKEWNEKRTKALKKKKVEYKTKEKEKLEGE